MMLRFFLILCLFCTFSCSPRNLTYLSDLDASRTEVENIINMSDPRIKPSDRLDISITSLSAESNQLFNKGVIQTGGQNATAASGKNDDYLVDKNGYVTFPVLGKIHLENLTKEEATLKLTTVLANYARDPIVNIRFTNFKLTVIGEVNNPSTFNVENEKINVFEALGLAGDLTPYGKRDNILLIREQEGKRIMTRLNLNSKDILNSPYFYLHQNDILYVEPDKVRAIQVSGGRSNFQFGMSVGLSLLSVATILLFQIF